MKKHMAICAALGLATGLAFAQSEKAVTIPGGATTSTADAAHTSMSALMAQNFTEEKLQARWKAEENLYKQSGLSEDKIQKLHDLNVKTWKAMASGEKTDYEAFIRERNAILTPEEMQKLRTTQRQAITERIKQRHDTTTATKDEATTPSM